MSTKKLPSVNFCFLISMAIFRSSCKRFCSVYHLVKNPFPKLKENLPISAYADVKRNCSVFLVLKGEPLGNLEIKFDNITQGLDPSFYSDVLDVY